MIAMAVITAPAMMSMTALTIEHIVPPTASPNSFLNTRQNMSFATTIDFLISSMIMSTAAPRFSLIQLPASANTFSCTMVRAPASGRSGLACPVAFQIRLMDALSVWSEQPRSSGPQAAISALLGSPPVTSLKFRYTCRIRSK